MEGVGISVLASTTVNGRTEDEDGWIGDADGMGVVVGMRDAGE